MEYFDVNAMIGPHFATRFPCKIGVQNLLENMDRFAVDRAVVYHGLAREYDLEIGNRELCRELTGHEKLFPCWVFGIHHTGSSDRPEVVVKNALQEGVKVARLFFGGMLSDTQIIDPLTYGELFQELENHRLPVIVEFEGSARATSSEIQQLDWVLETFHELPVILSEPKFGPEIGMIYPRLERYENLHIELSGLHASGVIEGIVARFGSRRLIYGSRYPWFEGGQVKIALAYAEITPDERKAIAAGNLDRLVSEIVK